MTPDPEPQDMAEALKEHFTELQVPCSPEYPRYVMSVRNRKKLEKIRKRVRELRGQS